MSLYIFCGECPEFAKQWAGQPAKAVEPKQVEPLPATAPTDGRRSVVAPTSIRRMPIDIAACWQHAGFDACNGTQEKKYNTTLCREIFKWLGLDISKPSTHGTRRPACMIGAIAAYIDRHPYDKFMALEWCDQYYRHCVKRYAPITAAGQLYERIAKPGSTEGKEKIRVFFNTFMALKAHCRKHEFPAFSDPPEDISLLDDPVKVIPVPAATPAPSTQPTGCEPTR